MLVRAIHTIMVPAGAISPGSEIEIEDAAEVARLSELGAVEILPQPKPLIAGTITFDTVEVKQPEALLDDLVLRLKPTTGKRRKP